MLRHLAAQLFHPLRSLNAALLQLAEHARQYYSECLLIVGPSCTTVAKASLLLSKIHKHERYVKGDSAKQNKNQKPKTKNLFHEKTCSLKNPGQSTQEWFLR